MCVISRRQSCTCSALTTRSSPTSTRVSTSASRASSRPPQSRPSLPDGRVDAPPRENTILAQGCGGTALAQAASENQTAKTQRTQRKPSRRPGGQGHESVPFSGKGLPSLNPTYATGAENRGKSLIIGKRCQKVSTTTWVFLSS